MNNENSPARTLLRYLALLVVALVVAGVLVWAIFFRHHRQSTPSPTGHSQPTSGSNHGSAGQKDGQPAPSAPKSNNSGTQSGSQTNNSGQLTNTGPGEVVAVFVTTSLLGTVGYQYFIRRRTASSR